MVIVIAYSGRYRGEMQPSPREVSRRRRCQAVHEAGRISHGMAARSSNMRTIRTAQSGDARSPLGDGLTPWSALERTPQAMRVASAGRTNESRCSAGHATSVQTTVTLKSAISNLDI
jgi:hypothetical protein